MTAVADSDLLPAKFSFLTLTTRHSNAIHYNDSRGFTEKKESQMPWRLKVPIPALRTIFSKFFLPFPPE